MDANASLSQCFVASGTVTLGHLVKLTGATGSVVPGCSGQKVRETTTSDQTGVIGVAGSTASDGQPLQVVYLGQTPVVTDGACNQANAFTISSLVPGVAQCVLGTPAFQSVGFSFSTITSAGTITGLVMASGGGGGGSGGGVPFSVIASGTNNQANMLVGTGASLSATGSGSIAATTVSFGGVTTGVAPAGTLTLGNGATLTTSGTGVNNANQIAGTTVAASTGANQVLETSATGISFFAQLVNCLDTAGQHMNFNTATHAWSCGTSGGTAGSAAFNTITSGVNTQANMQVGTGASLSVTGSGTIAATSVPFSGLTTGSLSSGTLTIATGATLTFSGSGVINASQVSSTTIPVSTAADQLINTTASGVGQWINITNCPDSGGNHLNYQTSTHNLSCGTSGGTAGSAAFNTITSGNNTQATMTVDTGASLSAVNSGSIVATAVAFSGVTGATSAAALVMGTGGSLATSGSGTINANLLSGTTVGVNSAADQVLLTVAAAVGSWAPVPNCLDTAGQHLNYNTGSHMLLCGSTSSGGGGGGSPAGVAGSVQIASASSTFAAITGFAFDSPTSPTVLHEPVSLSIGGPQPWADIREYGANPRFSPIPTTTASANTGAATTVTLASAIDFQNGEGITIWSAGASTTQSTPAAPTLLANYPVHGSGAYNYQCVGTDLFGGLTAAGATLAVTTGPNTFGVGPIAISSISQTSGTVTVNFSSPINASANQHIAITGVTGGGTTFNGVWLIASAPTTSQVTYALAGSAGSGTVTGAFGRLTNAVLISSITRSGTTITVTTDVAHNYAVQSGNFHTKVLLTGIFPYDLNGEYILDAVSSTTLTFNSTGVSATETGSATSYGGTSQMVATAYEYLDIACPVFTTSSPTVAYYVYGDRGTGSFHLLGKTLNNARVFRDWGWLSNGFPANGEGFVPGTPPGSPTPQMYTGKIVSGAGSTILTVSPGISNTVSGAFAQHNDGLALVAAAGTFSNPRTVMLSIPIDITYPTIVTQGSSIIINPNVQQSTGLFLNETLYYQGMNRLAAALMAGATSQSFGSQPYIKVTGSANPMMGTLQINGTSDVDIRNVQMLSQYNGQTLILFNTSGANEVSHTGVRHVAMECVQPTCIPLVWQGPATDEFIEDGQFLTAFGQTIAQGGLPNIGVAGQISLGPEIGAVWMKGGDQGDLNAKGQSSLHMHGYNSFSGRGIDIDQTYSNNDTSKFLLDAYEDQQPVTPFVMLSGGFTGTMIEIRHAIMDSNPVAVFANWMSFGGSGVTIRDVNTSFPATILTGHETPGIVVGAIQVPGVVQSSLIQTLGQNYNLVVPSFSNALTCCITYQGQELDMVSGSPIIYPITPPVLTSLTSPGSGTLASGQWNVEVTAVGWNNGETQVSNQAFITVNGSQNIQVNWTGTTNVKGYNVYAGQGGYVKQNTTPVAGLTFTFATFSNQGGAPTVDTTGSVTLDSTEVITPLIRLTDTALNEGDLVVTHPLTGNRVFTFPDVTGTVSIFTGAAVNGNCVKQVVGGSILSFADGGVCGGGGGGSSIFTQYTFGNQTPIGGTGNYIQTTYPSIFVTTQTGAGSSGSPFIDAITLASQSANTVFANCTGGSAAPTFCSITQAMLPSIITVAGAAEPTFPVNLVAGTASGLTITPTQAGSNVSFVPSGAVGIALGGTGQTTAASAFNALIACAAQNTGTMIYYQGPNWACIQAPTSPASVAQTLVSIPTGLGASQIPQWQVTGVPGRASVASSDTLVSTDRASLVTLSNAGSIAISVTSATTLGGNYTNVVWNLGSTLATLTPTAGLINGAGSQGLPGKWFLFNYSIDNTNFLSPVLPTISSFPTCNTGTVSALNFTPAVAAPITCQTIQGVNAATGNPQTGNGYAIQASDCARMIPLSNANPQSVTLLGTAPTDGCWYDFQNIGTGTWTISRNGLTIDGGTTNPTISTGQGMRVYSLGGNYVTQRGVSGAGAAPRWDQVTSPSGNLGPLSMAANTSEFDYSSAVDFAFKWANTTAATNLVAQSSPILRLCGQGWEGGSPLNTQDCLKLQLTIGNGANPAVTMSFTDTGTSTGTVAASFPNLVVTALGLGVVHSSAGGAFTSSPVTSADIANGAVGTLDIANLAITTALLANNAVTSAKLAVANTYGTCDIPVGDTSASALTNGQLGPQSRVCFIPAAATIVEMDVNADGGTPNIIVGRNRAGSIVNIVSAALATASSGGIACSNTGGTTGINGATTCSSTLQNTGLNAGDYLELVSGTAGGVAKFMVAHIIYTIN